MLLSMAALQPIVAQQEVMSAINDIKRKAVAEGYLTEETMAEARTDSVIDYCAKGILYKLGGGYTLADIKPYLQEKVLKRGSGYLVFVYLKKSMLGTPSGAQTTTSSEHVRVQPRFEVNNSQPETTPSTAPARNTTQTATTSSNRDAAEKWVSPIVRELLIYKDADSILRCLADMKAQGRIADYGSYGKSTDIDNQYVLLFESIEPYTPIAVLSPVILGLRRNLKTRETDSLDNHAGCRAIWFTLK